MAAAETAALVGRLLSKDDGEPIAELSRDGKWKGCDPKWEPISDALAVTHDLNTNYETGDHHTPPGSALLARAADAYGFKTEHAQKPYGPLPEGVVS